MQLKRRDSDTIADNNINNPKTEYDPISDAISIRTKKKNDSFQDLSILT